MKRTALRALLRMAAGATCVAAAVAVLLAGAPAMAQTITLSLDPERVAEDGGTTQVTVTATRPEALTYGETLRVTPMDGTATSGTDYAGFGNFTMQILANETSGTRRFTFTPLDDSAEEGDETVILSASRTGSTTTLAPVTLTITDDEAQTITLSLDPSSVAEDAGATPVTVTAELAETRSTATEVTVSRRAGGTAISGTDYAAVDAVTVTIPAEQTSGTGAFTFTPTDDSIFEGDETLVLSGRATGLTGDRATLTITEDDQASTAADLSMSPKRIWENAGETTVTWTVELNGAAWPTDAQFSLAPVGGSTDQSDFSGSLLNTVWSITIPAGQTSATRTFPIAPSDDDLVEGPETVIYTLLDHSGRDLLVESTETVVIVDDDVAAPITLSVSPEWVAEDAGATAVTVTAALERPARPTDTEVTVSRTGGTAISGTDYAAVDDFTVTIPAEQTSATATFTFTPTNDSATEDAETVILSASATGEKTGTATLTISDDESTPTNILLSVSPESVAEDAGATTVTVTAALNAGTRSTATNVAVVLSPAAAVGSRVPAISGTDYAAVNFFTVTIPAEQTSATATFTFTPTDDTLREPPETVMVSGAPVSGQGLEDWLGDGAPLTIDDDDAAAPITLGVSPDEVWEHLGAKTMTVTAVLDGPARSTSTEVTVSRIGGRAFPGTDYTPVAPITVTIPANQTSGTATFTFTPTNDSATEGAETVILGERMGGRILNTTSSAAFELLDDETLPKAVGLSLDPSRVAEDAGATTVTVTVEHLFEYSFFGLFTDFYGGRTRPEATVLTVSRTGGTATSGTDYAAVNALTVTIPALQSSATATFTFTPEVDDASEGDETVILSASGEHVVFRDSGAQGVRHATLTIDDAVPTAVSLSLDPSSVAEDAGATTVTVTAALVGGLRLADTEVTVSRTAGTATSGTDYAAVNDFTVTIPARQRSGTATFTFTPTADEDSENNETVILSGSATDLTAGTATLTIIDNSPPTFANTPEARSVAENTAAGQDVGAAVTADDTDTGDTLSYSLEEGADAASFDIVSTSGQIRTKSALDHETTPSYSVTVKADDGQGGSATVPVTITVTDVEEQPETPPAPTGTTGTDRLTVTWTAPDRNGGPALTGYEVRYKKTADTNWSSRPHSGTGTTATITGLDPGTEYEVQVRALNGETPSDWSPSGTGTTAEVPTAIALSLDPSSVAEDAGATTVTVTAALDAGLRLTDTEVTVSRTAGTATSGTDYAAVNDFTVTIPALQTSGTATFTFTPTADEDSENNETVILSGSATDLTAGTATLTIIDNSPPTFANTPEARSVAENTAPGQDVGAAVTAADTDTGDTLSYSLEEGADAASFDIVSTSGQIRTKSALDHETTPSYSVTVKADDGQGGSATVPVTITVTDVEEQPETPPAPAGTTGTDRLMVTWTAPDRNGGPALTGYEVRYKKTADTNWSSRPHSGTGTTATITGLDPGTGYEVQVRALNGETPSDWSPSGTGTTGTMGTAGTVSAAPTDIPSDWSLVPSDLAVGNTFRLLFRSSGTRDATSTDIGDYNTFVQNAAAAGHADIQAYRAGFRAVASTADVDARVNTGTFYTQANKGPPIYWLGGVKLADDYEDFYDGTWDEEGKVRDEDATEVTVASCRFNASSSAWTGSDNDGTEAFRGTTSGALGGSDGDAAYGILNCSVGGTDPLYVSFGYDDTDGALPLYGLSQVFRIVAAQSSDTLALTLDAIATDDVVNIAEKTAGFAITGATGSEAGVSVTVTVGTTELTATSASADPATWSVSVPADATYITGTSVPVSVTASKSGFTSPSAVTRTLAVDLAAPSVSYTAPPSLKVGVAMTAVSPSTSDTDIDAYSATGLPSGLAIDASTGVISGTPDTADADTASATVTVTDTAGNPAEVSIVFPLVAEGDQTLSGFKYSAETVTFGDTAPTLTAPEGAEGALSYAATPGEVCTVDETSGALTIVAVGECVVTATAASTVNYNEAMVTFTVTVLDTLVLNVDAIAIDDVVNIAEKAAGFAIAGDTGSEAGVSVTVTVGTTDLTATSAAADPATWSVSVPAGAAYITETGVPVSVTASKSGFTSPSAVTRTLAVDLAAPSVSYTAPSSLKVGVAITAVSPSTSDTDIDAYSATGLPSGLSIDESTGVISGTPDTADADTASATVTVTDTAGNPAEVSIVFPLVAKGDQTLSGFKYSADTVTFGSAAPTLTAPMGAEGTLSYTATPAEVCTVDETSGALTIVAAGECVVTATAAGTVNYNEASVSFTVTVQSTLALTLDAIATDDVVNIAEKAAGFAISGATGSEVGVSVSVAVGSTTVTATSADDGNGTAAWSVSVPADATYITGPGVAVSVSASKAGFTSPSAVTRTLAVDLAAPSVSYTAPSSLKVGVAITAVSPSTSDTDIDAYSATGLPSGLAIDASTGVISGTPDTADANTASATVTVSDTAGNPAEVSIVFPLVAKGAQTLSGFKYSAETVTFGSAAPTLTAPMGAEGALSYAATPTGVCTVDETSGALTIVAVGECVVTATAAGTVNYNEAAVSFTVTVQSTLALTLDAIATDNVVNIAEKAAGFAITGATGSEAGVSVTVTVGTTELTATSAAADPATWSVGVPANATYITGPGVAVSVSASKAGFTAPSAVDRTLEVDLAAPSVSYTAPSSLKVGVAITAVSPSTSDTDLSSYSATGLPSGLSIDESSGVISGTPDTADADTASATVTVTDTAGNPAEVSITFPLVAKGDQTLSGFAYSAETVTFGDTAPTLTAPEGAEGALSYAATPGEVCTVDETSGALTIVAVGECVVTATAAGTVNYNEAAVSFTVTVQSTLALTLDAIATDNVVNIAEKAAGFAISGATGSEVGVSVSVAVGSTTVTATSADDGNGTAAWSVSVPANAAYITGPGVSVSVTASKSGFTSPSAVTRTLAVDLAAPSVSYTAPSSLKVGVAITAVSPSTSDTDLSSYSATGLPSGLSIDESSGVISGTPDTADANTASVAVTVTDTAGNPAEVSIVFPLVAEGDQTLSGFKYSADTVTFESAAPTLTAPMGAVGTLSYTATPAAVCTVDEISGALTIVAVGECVVTATAAGTVNYNEAAVSFTVTVQSTLALTLDAIATDNVVNIAEKAAGFAISGATGSEVGVSVSVAVGSTTLTATSADDGNGTAAWSVSVPANAAYITGPGVSVSVTASKSGFTSPSAVTRTLAVDLAAPSVSYTAPSSLKVGVAITAVSPSTSDTDIDAYSATGLPSGLSIDESTGVISGTPDTADADTASATVTVSDTAGNPAEVPIVFPLVAKGAQTLSGFAYSAETVTFGSAAPTLTAPMGAVGTLSYTATPGEVCTVDETSGALTIVAAGACVVTATAASTANYNEASVSFTVTVQSTLVLTLDAIATDNVVNIAEKAAGFAITGATGSEAGVSVTVTVGTTDLTATSAAADPATWSVSVPANAAYITGTGVPVSVTASKSGFASPSAVTRTLAVDLAAPSVSYTAPSSLKVGVAITAVSPSTSDTDIDAYSATGLPSGLSIDESTGVISGTPDTADANTASVTVTVTDTAGNPAEVPIVFPLVAKGDQTLSGFKYSAETVTFGSAAPTLTAPMGAVGTLSYTATPAEVCTVDETSGELTIVAAGECVVTATAAGTVNYNEAMVTFTVTVQSTLALTLDAIATDNVVNIAEKAAGFAITGATGSEAGVSVTVTVGTTDLTATSASADPATWSVSVPAGAAYITGTGVPVSVTASKSGFTSPSAVDRTLAVDLAAPSVSYTAPSSLKVGVAMTAVSPSTSDTDIDAYSATGLPSGLAIDASTGVISGTPDTADANTASVTVTVTDTAGNPAEVPIVFPLVAEGDQTLSGFKYSADTVTFGSAAPTLTAPMGAEGALSYTATPAEVCAVDETSGALTIVAAGECVVTATAASTANYNEASVSFTVTVQSTLALTLDAIATDNVVNIAEKAAGFAITGATGSEAGVSVTVTVGTTELTATSAAADPATWSVSVPANAAYITGTGVPVSVTASKSGFASPSAVTRTLAVDLAAPSVSYTAPSSLKVGVAITAVSPSTSDTDIDAYSATGLPSGLAIDASTGVISGTPDTADANTASATVTVSDTAGNPAEVPIVFPLVAKGDQTLSGLKYSAETVTFGSAAPTLTAPMGAEGALSYAATPGEVCTVDETSGALTIVAVGECVVTATAAGTVNYNEAAVSFTVTVQSTLALTLDAIATDNVVNIAEKAAGFAISGATGSEVGVSVSVAVGSTTVTATSADDGNGTAAWSVSVPANAAYITGPGVSVSVTASKSGFTSPSAVTRTLAVDLAAPSVSYTAPSSLKVGVAITAVSPSTSDTDLSSYSATGLPSGLSIDESSGVISGTPDTADANTASVAVTVTDTAGNPAEVSIVFPLVAEGDQTLSGFKYSADTVTFESAAPTLTAPMGAVGTLSYTATPAAVCTVDEISGALTIVAVGECVITATAAGTVNYNEAMVTFTVTVLDTLAVTAPPIVSATFGRSSAEVQEGGSVLVTVRLSQAPEREVVLPIVATRGTNLAADEYEGVPASVTITEDAVEARFTVAFEDDAVVEGNETLTLTFGTLLPDRVNSAGANPQLVLTVTDDDGPAEAPDVSVQTSDGFAVLSWPPVANDSPILRYEVRWKEEGGDFNAWRSVNSDTSYRAEGLTNGRAYEFEVRAVNAHGYGGSASSSGTPTERLTGIPKVAQGLWVRATDSGRAELSWGRPSNATDRVTANSATATFSQIQGYRIEVCLTSCDDETNWYALVANTGKFEHKYVHQVLAPGVIRENRYRVRAININGKAGPWSNVATLDETVVEGVSLQTPDDSTLWLRFRVRNPDGNLLHVRYENTGTGTVGYTDYRLTKKEDVKLVLSGLEADSWYRVDLDFSPDFDSPRKQSHWYGTAREGETPLTSPYARDLLDAQVWQGGTWRDASTAELYIRMGATGTYRVRLKPCTHIYTVIPRRIEAPAGRLRASPTDIAPTLFRNLHCEVEGIGFRTDENGNRLTLGDVYDMTNFPDRANDFIPIHGGSPNDWYEVTVTARALEDYPSDTRADALLSAPFAVVYNHDVSYGSEDTRSGPVSDGTGLVRILVDRPADAVLPVPGGVTIGSDRVMSWDAVPGAWGYLVEWRHGPRYGGRANQNRSLQAASSVTLPPGASGRGPVTARVRAYSDSGVSGWSAEWTWDSRQPTLNVFDTVVNEADGSVGFLVTLDPAATGTVTVQYTTQDDTAVAPADYTAMSGTVTFAPGETRKQTALVPIMDDGEEDSGETFRLVLSSPTGSDANNGAAVLGDAEAVATILNSEREAASLTGFTLVDAGTNADLMLLAEGSTVRLGELLASSYGIRAEMGPGAAPGSVRLELSGAKTVTATDDAAPWSLYGDGAGRINGASLPPGSYTLSATAYSDSGGRGEERGSLEVSFAATAAVAATVPDAPGNPAAATADGREQELTVSWTAPASDGGAAITGYRVQWKSGSESYDGAETSTRQAVVTGLTHMIAGLTNGVTYTVRIVAVNEAGDGDAVEVSAKPRDRVAPVLSKAVVDGTSLALTYGEALDEDSAPDASAFAVTVAEAARTVDAVAVSGSTAVLTLASAVASGETVTVDYTVPTGAGAKPLQDAAGNGAASFTGQAVTNETEASNTAPTGLPAISGTPQVGVELTASASAIVDGDGTENATFVWQWLSNDGTEGAEDTEIAEATLASYTPKPGDVGKTQKVRVTFTDDKGTEEVLVSAATAAVAAAPVKVSIAAASTPVTEGSDAVFTLTRTGAATAALTVGVSVSASGAFLDGTAPSEVAFAANAATATLRVATADDGAAEAEGRVSASVAPGTGYAVAAGAGRASVDVFDDDEAPAVTVLWSATMTVADHGTGAIGAGSADLLTDNGGSAGLTGKSLWYYPPGRKLRLGFVENIPEAEGLTLHVGDLSMALPAGSSGNGSVSWDGVADVGWSDGETIAVRLTARAAEETSAAPGLSVADAQVREAAGAALAFQVTLDAAQSSAVSVRYATSDGTAVAGSDYVAARGSVRFAPGQTSKTVRVLVLEDAHDDNGETMTLKLTSPFGATLADGTATGTIENTDPIPQAWLARFGRTVAGHVVDAISGRFEGSSGGGSQVTLGGQRLSLAGADGLGAGGVAADTPESEAVAREGLAAIAGLIGRGADGVDGADGVAWPHRDERGSGEGWMRDRGGYDARGMTGRELLLGSSFHLSLGGDGDGAQEAATLWTAWGQASSSRFDGEADGRSVDGEVTTFTLGADAAWARWLAGVAVSLSEGEGGFRDHPGADDESRGTGVLESTLTSVHPYLRYEASERLSVWGILGYGTGELGLELENGERWTTDTAMQMAAAGARGVLVPAADGGGFELAARTDAQLVRMTSDAASGSDGGKLEATQSGTSRLRFMLEGSRAFALEGGGALTPSLEVGLRHDGGDAETGTGIEVGGGLSYTDAATGITVDAKVRGLLAHEDADYREWGASGSVRIEPDASGRGLSLSLAPAWGADSGGAERLWSAGDARGLAPDGAAEPESRLEAELGYGFSVFDGRGVATPRAGWLRTGEDEALRLGQRLRLGSSEWRLESEFGETNRAFRAGYGYRVRDFLDLNVEASRHEAANDDAAPGHEIRLRARLRW